MSVHALIVGAAPHQAARRFYRQVVSRFDIVVACDAAAEWCLSLGRAPDVAVGDFDSAAPGAVERLMSAGVEVLVYPRDKDASDLDLAARHVASLAVGSLTFTAAFSKRLDHTLAAIGTMRDHAELWPMILEPSMTAWLLSDRGRIRLVLDAPRGAVFSIVGLEPVTGLTVTGARYPAERLDLPALSSISISNESLGNRVDLAIESGTALVMLMHSPENRL